jgi:O-antigen ligase
LTAILKRRISLDEYLILSTVVSAFLLIIVVHIGLDVFLGYPIVFINSAILFAMKRLVIHPNHALAIGAVAVFSVVASIFSPTPLNSILSQIAGISVMSIYYFSMLTTSGLTIRQWLDIYARVAFALCLFGFPQWIISHVTDAADPRLRSIFTEPALYVYTTLPALGYFLNCWFREKRYGKESLIFVLSYLLADSALGFVGLLLTLILIFGRHLSFWRIMAGLMLTSGIIGLLFIASGNFRLRISDTAVAIATQDLSGSNASTFALLSNFYVAGRAFLSHPLLGVGIGGYGHTYDIYIEDLTGVNLTNLPFNLNKEDANSLFLRVAAELGLPGLVTLFGFLITCGRVRGSPYREVRNVFLPYIIVRMSRFGAYFSMEVYFFMGLYLLNYLSYRRSLGARASVPQGLLPAP